MRRTITTLVSSFATVALLTFSAIAADTVIGDLTLSEPVARATPATAKVGGGYIKITNNGSEADRLVSVSADFAGMSQVHEMKMQDDVMKMKHLEEGLEIPAGETVTLKPGGYHLMFMRLKEPLSKGEERKVTLTFEKAGSVDLTFTVKSLAETMEMN
ncbi:copper chaperone PCu(A)C [Pseudahrensia aquimaris]|uniref:Copper chaperone PCu(A)C n=1 Tax=Pseudahrensia aquimaris TaxID=744461 RepID=A0ABW3FA31_9HYPH